LAAVDLALNLWFQNNNALPASTSFYIASWNGDGYGDACITLSSAGAINVADCAGSFPALCELPTNCAATFNGPNGEKYYLTNSATHADAATACTNSGGSLVSLNIELNNYFAQNHLVA